MYVVVVVCVCVWGGGGGGLRESPFESCENQLPLDWNKWRQIVKIDELQGMACLPASNERPWVVVVTKNVFKYN